MSHDPCFLLICPQISNNQNNYVEPYQMAKIFLGDFQNFKKIIHLEWGQKWG
jgi:hypothetical protein